MTLDSVANFITLILSQGYGASDTTITVASGGSSLPAAPFNMVWWNSTDYPNPANDPNVEIVRVTKRERQHSHGFLRAQESTLASTKNNAGKTYSLILGITAKMITDIGANLQKPWKLVTVTGTISGVNTIFTLNGLITPYDANSPSFRLTQASRRYRALTTRFQARR